MRLARLAFFLLVLTNLAFFVWAQGYLGGEEEGREPQRLKEQLQPEKIQVAVQVAQAAPPQPACRRVEGLAVAEAERLRQAFETGSDLRASVQTTEQAAPVFLVSIPALATQILADRKAGELKQLGVADFQVTQAGGAFAISLGSFADETVAKDYLLQMNKKGVRSARIEVKPGTPGAAILEVRGAAATLEKRLSEVLAGSAVSAIACP